MNIIHNIAFDNKIYSKLLLIATIILNLFAISNVTFSQGRRDLDAGKFFQYKGADSLRKPGDTTLSRLDSLRRLPVDSTARIKYFKYVPKYSYGILSMPKSYPLLLEDAASLNPDITFDSLGSVIVRQMFSGEDIKAPAVIPVKKYIEKITRQNEKKIFSELFAEKFKGVSVDDLARLFEKFTDITIPLPFKTETIFGPPTFNLRINGAIDITASYQKVESDQSVVSYASNTQNNINFKQEVQVTAKGSVGDKLTIDADWNTQRVFDFENQLKIKYQGYADEVIQKIEAGNVSLDTKSSLIQSTQALFGIRGEFKLGPLTLSTVVSQKKSKQETKDYSGGIQEQNFSLNVYDYSDNHYFFDTLYKTSFIDVFSKPNQIPAGQTYNYRVRVEDLTSCQIWVQSDNVGTDKRNVVAITQLYAKPPGGYELDTLRRKAPVPGLVFKGYFRKMNPSEYYIDQYAGFISLKINVLENFHVAVTYTTQNDLKYGTSDNDVGFNDTLVLKMIKCQNQSPEDTPLAWELKMKNVYRLPVSKIIEDGFKCDVNYSASPGVFDPSILGANGAPINLSQVLGLDRYSGKSTSPPPDGIFDFLRQYTINTETGDIIFPYLKPFLDELKNATADSTYQFPEIYSKRKLEASVVPNASKYFIKGSAKGEAGISSTINLGFNIVPGSVKVMLGTQALAENIDYSVDYSTGIVVIKNAAALTSKDLKISYETNDLFSLASKTLIGARADYKINDKTNIGFTFINLKQETLNDKVRIGEEPTNNSMFGLDLTTEFQPKFLTKLVNLLPGYNTKEESTVNFKGEFAMITPDVNTKKSLIPQDNNESIAYIDDMEGAKKIVTLGTTYSSWSMSSVPVDSTIGLIDSERIFKKGRMRWYNIYNDVDVKKVYPLRDVQPGQDRLTPMYVSFNPQTRGTYNYNSHMDTTTKPTNWNGIMKYLNTTSTDLLNENINYIEFNMRVDNINNIDLNNARLIVDIGQVSEDVIPNGRLDTEDSTRTGILREQDDIGLDYLTDDQELALYNQINDTTLSSLSDPALDNNSGSNIVNYDLINGTSGNRYFEGGNRPDAEDLNRNGSLDLYNSYFEYNISLDTTNNKRISGNGEPGSGWFQYRIPLSEFTKAIGKPKLTNVEFARIWMTGMTNEVRIGLIDFNLVGNQWFKSDKNDTTYNISVVSIEENPQIYQSPVGGDILRQTIRNTTGNNTKSNEQSLALSVSNLTTGQRKMAIKDYQTQTIDLFNYKILKLFINGDPTFNYVNEHTYDAAMVVRFGSDSNNFYEYRAPIHPDIRPGQPWNPLNEVKIVFAELTSIKISRDSANQVVDIPVPNGPPGSYYRVKGNPTISAVREFELGVEKSRSGLNSTITGSVWFNEIRVLQVNNDNGYAFTLNAGMKLADFGIFNANFSKVDPNFHGLDARSGSRNTGQNWDASATINVHKLINNIFASVFSDEWKDFLNLPVSFRHSENLVKPKYYPGTDIDIASATQEKYRQILLKTNDEKLATEAAQNLELESQTYNVRNDFSISGLSLKFPGGNYFVKNYINKVQINFAASVGSFRDITYQSKTDFAYTGSFNFTPEFDLSDRFNIKIGKILNLGEKYKDAKLYFFIPLIPFVPLYASNFAANADFNRTRVESKQRKFEMDDPVGRVFTANRGFGFNWKFIENWVVDLAGTYNFKVGSDLTPFETYNDSMKTQKPESEIFKEIFFNGNIIDFGKDLDYTQTTGFNPKFNLPVINKYLDFNMTYNVAYGWRNPNSINNIGYTVGYSSTLNTGANIKLKELFSIFGTGGTESPPPDKIMNRLDNRLSNNKNISRLTKTNDDKPGIKDVINILKSFIPEAVTVSYNSINTLSNSGVSGNPGFGNFWLAPMRQDEGPSRMYQLGLNMDPGVRVPGLAIMDMYNLSNNMSFTASITPIFPQSVRMNLTFKSDWGFNNSAQYLTEPDGSTGPPTTRSFSNTKGYSMFFAGDIEKFRFESSNDPDQNIQNISSQFKSNIGSFPFPNWSLTISGVEKFPLFAEIASSVTLENNFTSEYIEGFSLDSRNIAIPTRQAVTQSFSPLLGVNMTFKELFGGSLTATFKLNKSKTNTLVPSSSLIQTLNTSDWSINANYSKAGFEIPLFGLSLKNDISFALTFSKNTNNPTDYRFAIGDPLPVPLPGNGSAVTTINPSVQYSLSAKVQMQLFYKYIKTEPTQNTASTIPRTSNEGGLNIRISIQ